MKRLVKDKQGKSKYEYENEDKLLDILYDNNKEFIDKRLKNISVSKLSERTIFKDIVKEYTKQGLTLVDAINKTSIYLMTISDEIEVKEMKRLFKDKQGNNLYLTFQDIYDEEELNKAIKENIDIIAFSSLTKEKIKIKYQLQGKKFEVPEGYKYKAGMFNFYTNISSCYCSFCFYKKDLDIDFTPYHYKNRNK